MSNPTTLRRSPGPGSVFSYRHLVGIRRDPLVFYRKVWQRYGDVAHIPLPASKGIYLLNHPEDIYKVLRTKSCDKGPLIPQMKALLDDGLLTAEGEEWLLRRRAAQPAFHPQCLEAAGPTITQKVEAIMQQWQKQGGQPIDVVAEMVKCVLSIVSEIFFGSDISGISDKLNKALRECSSYVHYRAYRPFAFSAKVPTLRNRVFLRQRRQLHLVAQALLDGRSRLTCPRDDLLGRFVALQGTGAENIESVRGDVITFLMAGVETTALALSWALYLLAQHGDATQQLYEELDRNIAGRLPEVKDISRLAYTNGVVQEALRLYPPAWAVGRVFTQAGQIREYDTPAGSTFVLNFFNAHRHPDVWENPGGFDPSRFGTDRFPRGVDKILLPFAEGRRGCIGKDFAMMEMVLIIATIMQRYRLQLAPGRPQPKPVAHVTLRPHPGIHLTVHPR